ncbi:UNVERIFIED_ORG: transposase [Arthrobacter sp. UYCu721]
MTGQILDLKESGAPWPKDTGAPFSGQILDLKEFLLKEQVNLVVMEATSDYWRPFYYLLEDEGLSIMVVNARDARNVPGRKTDVSDVAWLAELGAHGLVRASFVPRRQSGNCGT